MIPYINRNASKRKKRLLAVAFCRHISPLISETRCRRLLKEAKRFSAFGDEPVPKRPTCLLQALDAAERCADGLISVEDLATLSHIADRLSFVAEYYYACYDKSWGPRDYKLIASSYAAAAVSCATSPRIDIEAVHQHAAWAVHRGTGSDENEVDPEEERAQCELVRDLFSTPSCSLESGSKRSLTKLPERARKVAEAIYADGRFTDVPILADAPEDSGWTDAALLDHFRGPGPHVRGCWAVDLVLAEN
jgi:hypothetical protein